jgi:hypothetical protein
VRFDNFHVDDGHLVLGWKARALSGERLLQFDPQGIWVHGVGDSLGLRWNDYVDFAARPDSWSLEPNEIRIPRAGLFFRVIVWRRQPDGRTDAIRADAMSRTTPFALPLAHFLGTMPELRAQLADPVRLQRLLDDVAAFQWFPRPPLRNRFRSRTYDAISEELDRRLHRYEGRTIAGEPMVRLEDVLAAVRARGVDARHLERKIRRHVEVVPWPFGALRP